MNTRACTAMPLEVQTGTTLLGAKTTRSACGCMPESTSSLPSEGAYTTQGHPTEAKKTKSASGCMLESTSSLPLEGAHTTQGHPTEAGHWLCLTNTLERTATPAGEPTDTIRARCCLWAS